MTEPLPTAALPTGNPEEVGLSQSALDRLSTALNSRIASGHIPGAVALVARHGKVAYHESFGRQDPASDKPMATDAVFRIYSMTKAIVSVRRHDAVGRRPGSCSSDPISKYIPAFADTQLGVIAGDSYTLTTPSAPITIQDLLRHTSGLTYEFRGATPIHKAYTRGPRRPPQADQRRPRRRTRRPAAVESSPAPLGNTAAPPTCSAASWR